jgi:hypothetical protein
MVDFFKKLFSKKQSQKEPIYFLVRYRDEHMKDYMFFWTKDNKQIGPSFKTAIEAKIWLESNTEKSYEHYI